MPAPGYIYLTLGAARTQLAQRLEDPTYVYWTIPELNSYINLAVRTWQALTATWKQRAAFVIEPGGGVDGSAFYDLNESVGVLNFSVTDEQVINVALAMLLEPPLTATWTGTGQFQFSQIVASLQNRINRWLTDTGANTARNIQDVGTGPSASRLFLPPEVLDVRRAAWLNVAGTYSTLWRDDEYAMQSFKWGANLRPATPQVWGKFVVPPVGIDIYPPPANPGQVETLVVTSGPQIGASPAAIVSNPTVLDIPEDFVWGMIFGALSDLLSADGPMRDPDRAAYSESRYQESVELYRMNPTLLLAQINGVQIWAGAVFELDAFLASWQSKPGRPRFAAMCDHNLCAFGPTPDAAYGVVMDVACNIPVPVNDADYIQVPSGALAPLLDYCEHLASWKMAGYEFKAKDTCRQNFYAAAALENNRITKGSFYRAAMQAPALRQAAEVPRI